MGETTDSRVIKRYANRKLYDTQHSKYVTLEQISEMIRNGEDVKIVDNKSKEDLTSVTLAQIIFEEEKKHSFMPLGTMRSIIQKGGEWITGAQERVSTFWPPKKAGGEDGEPMNGHSVDADGNPIEQTAEEASDENKRRGIVALRDWVQTSKQSLAEWQVKMDEKIRTTIEGVSPLGNLHKDVKVLQERIAELESKLKQLQDHDQV